MLTTPVSYNGFQAMGGLTKREAEIFEAFASGGDEREIAVQLGTSEPQLRHIWKEIRNKLARLDPVSIDDFQLLQAFAKIEHRQLGHRLAAAESRLHALMDIAPEAILIIDGRTGVIGKANNNAEILFGYSMKDLLGMSMESLVPEDKQEVHPLLRAGFLRSTRKREIGYHPPIFALRSDGSVLPIEIALTASQSSDEVMVVCRASEYPDHISERQTAVEWPPSAARDDG